MTGQPTARLGTYFGKGPEKRQLSFDLRDYAHTFGGVLTIEAIQRVAGCEYHAAAQRFSRIRKLFDRMRVPYEYVRPHHQGQCEIRVSPSRLKNLADRLIRDVQDNECFACGTTIRLEQPGAGGRRTAEGSRKMMRGNRERMPKRRDKKKVYDLDVLGSKGRVTIKVEIGCYDDGRMGEIFINSNKQGTFFTTSMNTWATSVSKAIQFGMPVSEVVSTFRDVQCNDGFGAGKIACAEALAIDGVECSSLWDAVARLIEAEIDEDGRHKDFVNRPT